ncbi:glycoside hydrolase family 43 protein [Sphingomonas echinoides]|uniref:Glycoside hydrolase family 43 protein n=2 Tax=Pseudomonadota TaxID=1224 RepID=A0ABU4PJX0_9SPHN|nr:glycoside hydrolase family 43 protein [Sphingomonas echinoides]MDX5984376.1 glycoside hydrolase family 43 protein [Sphingomonas echinoides]
MRCRGPIAALLLAWAGAANADPARFQDFSYQGRSEERVAHRADAYSNPILSGYYPDPSVTRVGDEYFLVNSSFSHFPGLPIFRSKDLVSWTQIGNAIDRPEQIDFTGRTVSQSVFAPDISYHDGIFYIVNTCVQCGGNFVITAKNPAGPWSNPVWLPFEGIDPSIFWDGDTAYIVNNGAPDETPRYEGHRAIWMQAFDWRTLKLVGPRTQIVNGGVDLSKKPIWIEGPHLLKRDGRYYLIAAEGGTSDNHSEVVFRADSVDGPYVPFPGNPILTQRTLDPTRANPVTSAGHAKFVQTQNGDWWATFLATRPYKDGLYNIGRETFLLPVTWRDGWPQILPAGTAIPFVAQRPKLPKQPAPALPLSGDFGYVETFKASRLGPQWVGIRTPKHPVYRLDRGALVLERGAALGDISGAPAFIGRRQQHPIATVSTTLRYSPDTDGEGAGLAAVQNDRSYLVFGITRIAGKAMIALYTRDNADADTLVAAAPIATAGPVTLTIRANGGTMAFDYRVGGKQQTLKAGLDDSFLSTKRAGGFVGTIIGPYAWNR